jgi:hypothetical protein
VAGEVSCTAKEGSYVVCPKSLGCSPGPLEGQVQCGDGNGGTGIFTCDGPSDCSSDSDCCTTPGTSGHFCVARAQSGVIGSGCAALDTNPNAPQSTVVCDPLNPTTTCPVGEYCTSGGAALASWGCH